MTEIAKMEAAPAAQLNLFDPAQFETMQRICKLYSSSELVPEIYRTNLSPDKEGKPANPESRAMANCMIALEIAHRIGASPLMVMQNMVPIYGKPTWSSKFLVATVNTCGRFLPLRFRFTNRGKLGKVEYVEYAKVWVNGQNGGKGYYKNEPKTAVFDGSSIDDLECVAWTTAKGSDEVLESSPVSVRLAVLEGWFTKNGSKWPTMTQQMLMYRAASFWTSAYAPELSMGMKTEYEVMDVTDVEFEDLTDRVKAEIRERGNAETIDMNAAPASAANQANEAKEEPPVSPQAEVQPEPPQQVGDGAQRQMRF